MNPGRSVTSRSSSPNRYTPTYLTRAQLDRAPILMAVQKIKSASEDISGEAWEEVLAEILGDGAMAVPGRGRKGEPDLLVPRNNELLRVSAKTRLSSETFVAIRPIAEDWLGHSKNWQMAMITPQDAFPAGKTILTASPRAIGDRVLAAYNAVLDGWDVLTFLVRLRCPELECWQYLYWEEPATLLDPSQFVWRDVSVDGWARKLAAWHKPRAGRRLDTSQTPYLRWSTKGGLTVRHSTPDDADIFEVRDSHLRDRTWATNVLLRELQAELVS